MQHEIPLTKPRVSLGSAIGLFLLVGVAGDPLAFMAILSSFTAAASPAAFVAMGVIGWGLLAGLSIVVRDTVRRMSARPVLRVGPHSLAVDDRSVFGQLEVPRDAVRAAALELNPHAGLGC